MFYQFKNRTHRIHKMAEENKYVMFMEKNLKENDNFIFYLQYNGNEQEIAKLKNVVDTADFSELWGDVSHFYIDTDNLKNEYLKLKDENERLRRKIDELTKEVCCL